VFDVLESVAPAAVTPCTTYVPTTVAGMSKSSWVTVVRLEMVVIRANSVSDGSRRSTRYPVTAVLACTVHVRRTLSGKVPSVAASPVGAATFRQPVSAALAAL
jgi:hypothetical protein